MPHMSAYAEVNGLKMYYETHGPTEGARRPLVLLHGGVHTIGLSFTAVLPALAEDRRVVAPELQGHGHTADTDRAMSVPQFADDVVALEFRDNGAPLGANPLIIVKHTDIEAGRKNERRAVVTFDVSQIPSARVGEARTPCQNCRSSLP